MRSAAADLAIVLTGGGARAAYQVGFLRCMARHFPALRFPIITGVSAGAINAAFLASYRGDLAAAAKALSDLWSHLTVDRVFRADSAALAGNFLRWVTRLGSGGSRLAPRVRGLVDTAPLNGLLDEALGRSGDGIPGIRENLEQGFLKAVALTTLDYSTGKTVVWVEGCSINAWERPNRRCMKTYLTVDHVMASAALPLFSRRCGSAAPGTATAASAWRRPWPRLCTSAPGVSSRCPPATAGAATRRTNR